MMQIHIQHNTDNSVNFELKSVSLDVCKHWKYGCQSTDWYQTYNTQFLMFWVPKFIN